MFYLLSNRIVRKFFVNGKQHLSLSKGYKDVQKLILDKLGIKVVFDVTSIIKDENQNGRICVDWALFDGMENNSRLSFDEFSFRRRKLGKTQTRESLLHNTYLILNLLVRVYYINFVL